MGSWTISSTLMCGPAWRPIDLEDLWAPPPNRGNNRTVPGVTGQLAKPRLIDARTVDVPFWITGACDQSGTPHSDPMEGFVTNVDTIWAGVVTPPTPPTVTRTSTLTMPDASTRVASILVEGFDYKREQGFGALARAVLTITIPAGAHYEP